MLIYIDDLVDDLIVTASNSALIRDFISSLCLTFPVKDLGLIHYFLGVEVTRTPKNLYLSQFKYITNLFHKTNLHNSKPVANLMSPSTKLSALDGSSFEDPQLYHNLVGSLQYSISLDLIFHSLLTRFASLCTTPRLLIGML